MKQQHFYSALPKVYYIAVLPVQGCFMCDAMFNYQVKDIIQKDKIVIIYPSTRKIVQEKLKKENKLDMNKVFYVFDDRLYQKFHDDKKPKGYILKVQK